MDESSPKSPNKLEMFNGNISDTSSSINHNVLVTMNREAILDNKI
mgnify:CR=1 FL=1